MRQLGRNSRPRGRNFALNGTEGEVGVSLIKNFFLREVHHSSDNLHNGIIFLGNSVI